MKKVIRYNEQDIERLVRKLVKESNTYDGAMERLQGDKPQEKREENYMFFQNLREIQSAVEELLSMDKDELDRTLTNGHDWASEHITTAKDDIEEVLSFFKHRTIEEGVINEGWKDAVVGGLLTLASLLPKTADAQQDGKVEWDTVKDTVTYISKDNDRDTVRHINTIATKIFKDADGNVDKIVRKIKDETTKPNSWDIKKTKERKIKEFIKIDPITKKEVRLVKKNWEKRNPWKEDKILYIDGGSVHPYFKHGHQLPPYKIYRVAEPEEFGLEEFKEYVKEYSRLLSLFGEKFSSLDKKKIDNTLNWDIWKK